MELVHERYREFTEGTEKQELQINEREINSKDFAARIAKKAKVVLHGESATKRA